MLQPFAGRVQQTELDRRGRRQRSRSQEAQWQPGRQHKSSDRAGSQVNHQELAIGCTLGAMSPNLGFISKPIAAVSSKTSIYHTMNLELSDLSIPV